VVKVFFFFKISWILNVIFQYRCVSKHNFSNVPFYVSCWKLYFHFFSHTPPPLLQKINIFFYGLKAWYQQIFTHGTPIPGASCSQMRTNGTHVYHACTSRTRWRLPGLQLHQVRLALASVRLVQKSEPKELLITVFIGNSKQCVFSNIWYIWTTIKFLRSTTITIHKQYDNEPYYYEYFFLKNQSHLTKFIVTL
jgi:hypothetical protein